MAKNTTAEKTAVQSLKELIELPRFSVEVNLFLELNGVTRDDEEQAQLAFAPVQALRAELGRIVANASDSTGIAKIGKIGKDGDRKVTIGKGTTTVKAGFVATLADAALWIGEGVKRTGGSLSVSTIANSFGDKHPFKVAALVYFSSKVAKAETKPEAPTLEPTNA